MHKTLMNLLNGGSVLPMPMLEGADEGGSNAAGGADDAAAAAAAAEAAAKANEDAAAAKAAADKANEDVKNSKADEGSDEAKKLLREVMDKKEKLKAAEERAAELENKLKAFEGIDADQVKQLLQREREAEKASEEAKGNFERVKQMMVEEHQKEKKTLADQVAELQSKLADKDSVIDRLTIERSFSDSPFIRDELILTPSKARQLYGDHFEFVDGKIVAYDKPKGSPTRTIMPDANGNPLSFEAAIQKLVENDPDNASIRRVKTLPGAGSNSQKVSDQVAKAPQSKEGLVGVNRILAALEAEKAAKAK